MAAKISGIKRKGELMKLWFKWCVFSVVALLLAGCALSQTANTERRILQLSHAMLNNKEQPFIVHLGVGRYSNYLAQNVNYVPVKNLFNQLQQQSKRSLKNRGEAHITVLTPVEYNAAFKGWVSMEQINQLASNANIQQAGFIPLCVGRGEAMIKDVSEYTYFVVITSNKLIELRQKLHRLLVESGGDGSLFEPSLFYPHITLGFTSRDLHLSDGVVKDQNSCYYSVVVD